MSKRNNAKSVMVNIRIEHEDIDNLRLLGEHMAENDVYGVIKSDGEVNLSAVIKYAYRQAIKRANIKTGKKAVGDYNKPPMPEFDTTLKGT